MAPTPPCSTARSVSSRIRVLSSALNFRRSGLAGTSGSGELATKGIATLASLTMILLAALLCNYGRGKCLIDVGTEGFALLPRKLCLYTSEDLARIRVFFCRSAQGSGCLESEALLHDESKTKDVLSLDIRG